MKKNIHVSNGIIRCIMILYSIIVTYPMLWAALTSLKTNQEFYESPWLLPQSPQFSNYVRAWVQADFGAYFFNSVMVTALSLVLVTILASSSSYVLARFSFKGKRGMIFFYLAGMMVPAVLIVIPTFFLLKGFGLLDSLLGLTLVYTCRTIPFSMFVLIGFYKTLPKSLEEAATIDGCSYARTFWQIMFPLATPGLVTVLIFNFIFYWNEFILALTFISTTAKKTLPVGMANMMEVSQYKTDWGGLFAGIMMLILPTLTFYVIFQKKITKGLTAGAVKG